MKLRFITVIFLQFLLIFILVPQTQAWWLLNQSGQLIKMDSDGQVLGDEDKGQRQEQKIEVKSEGKSENKNENRKDERKDGKSIETKDRIEFKPGESKREFENNRVKIKMEQKMAS
jgi:hypothetical protein